MRNTEHAGILRKCSGTIAAFAHPLERVTHYVTFSLVYVRIGPVIATGIVSAIDKGQQFHCPRDFAIWLGLTPRHHASGTKIVSLGLSKRGNRYLRTLFVHGARSCTRWCRRRDDKLSRWTNELIGRRGYHKAVAALAHKLARIAWTLLHKQEPYRH